ncbi:MAG: hypothetical protein M3Y17_02835 [Actinomycetota bacterium]|nr:hypothetical protein [Actinomycetota bacterium]
MASGSIPYSTRNYSTRNYSSTQLLDTQLLEHALALPGAILSHRPRDRLYRGRRRGNADR